jgi:FlaA1/EpsC-like NDP-sugar epimerase
LLKACIAGKNVMVTGAGGSIGSELCRQVIAGGPRCLVLYEFSESALYEVSEELRGRANESGVVFVPILGSTQDRTRVDSACRRHAIDTIFHAAAYKHVPLLEDNPAEGLRNNVTSARYVAEAAEANGVEVMVLISSDKAVRPSSVMGASKRFCELIVQALAERAAARPAGSRTRFCMVRFGNVLGSSGSVVPKFRAQIAAGGPVTVTHPEVVRYFMTIPEAAQLVLQASALAISGDIFVLDMGSPVRIFDLARRMVRLSGLSLRDERTPDGDIAIEITGLRPGEKLREELLIGGQVEPTVHPRIARATESGMPWETVAVLYEELIAAIAADDGEQMRTVLRKAIPDFAQSETRAPPAVARLPLAATAAIESTLNTEYPMGRQHHGF